MKKLASLGCVALGLFAGLGIAKVYDMKKKGKKDTGKEKFKSYYKILNQWLQLKKDAISLDKWFEDNSYTSIAIYGFGELGKRLYEELTTSNVKVAYVVDQSVEISDYEVEIYSVEDELPEVDVIVVSSVFDYEAIKTVLCEKVDCHIVSLEDVVFEL